MLNWTVLFYPLLTKLQIARASGDEYDERKTHGLGSQFRCVSLLPSHEAN